MATELFELETTAYHIDEHADGIPPALVEGLATEIVRMLVENGIDPNAAYFRGRQGEPEDLTKVRIDEAMDLADIDDESDPYDDILAEKDRREDAIEEALGRQIDGGHIPQYDLGTLDALFSDDTLTNPIHGAGVSDESFLDVYDRNLVDSFDPGQEEGLTKVVAIPDDQLALAAIARIKLNYVVVNEEEF